MSFISYAQNFEDVMLWRALQHVPQGFYIDVGANDPEVDSVTKAFYDRGWRGINIEPVPQWFARLERERPRDVNLQLAVGAQAGEMVLYEVPATGLSTGCSEIARANELNRGYVFRERVVPVETLTSIYQRVGAPPVHFLKVDVEGFEKEVLEGIDFSVLRPWILVIESTRPMTPEQNHQDWEQLLLAADYIFVYFDGLNRYYLALEHLDLRHHFVAPPNVFDRFMLNTEARLHDQVAQAAADMQSAEARTRAAEARARAAEAEYASILQSRSWRWMAPLRMVMNFGSACQHTMRDTANAVVSRVIYLGQRTLAFLIWRVLRHRSLSDHINRWLMCHFPALRLQLVRIAGSSSSAYAFAGDGVLKDLTPHGRDIYVGLKAAIDANNRKSL